MGRGFPGSDLPPRFDKISQQAQQQAQIEAFREMMGPKPIKGIACIPHSVPLAFPVSIPIPDAEDPSVINLHIYGGISDRKLLTALLVAPHMASDFEDEMMLTAAAKVADKILAMPDPRFPKPDQNPPAGG